MEAAVRTAYEIVTAGIANEGPAYSAYHGLEGIKKASLKIEGTKEEWKFLEGVELKLCCTWTGQCKKNY